MVQIWAFTATIVRFNPLDIIMVNKIIEGYSMGISFLIRTFLGGFYGLTDAITEKNKKNCYPARSYN